MTSNSDEMGALPGVEKATARMHGPQGHLNADRIADVFGFTHAQLSQLIGVSPEHLRIAPEAESIQGKLKPFEQIARLLVFNANEAAFRTWLNAPNSELEGRSPNEIIDKRGPHVVANLVRDILTNRGG